MRQLLLLLLLLLLLWLLWLLSGLRACVGVGWRVVYGCIESPVDDSVVASVHHCTCLWQTIPTTYPAPTWRSNSHSTRIVTPSLHGRARTVWLLLLRGSGGLLGLVQATEKEDDAGQQQHSYE
jgi:hypothetical protein